MSEARTSRLLFVRALGGLNWRSRVCTACLLCAATAIAVPAQTFTLLHSFDKTDGAYPEAALVQGAGGNFYGTTLLYGGHDGGTVFRITPSGKLTTLYRFCSQAGCTDGASPYAGLIQATNGDFYRTTCAGGGGAAI
jgi:uncharacterized repeat protein (TIGR03803 family)